MISNPLLLPPNNTVFLVGNYASLDSELVLAIRERELVLKGYSVINSKKIVHHQVDEKKEREAIFRKRVAYLAMCNTVITLSGWEKDTDAIRLVQIARTMDKAVILSENFERWEIQQKIINQDAA